MIGKRRQAWENAQNLSPTKEDIQFVERKKKMSIAAGIGNVARDPHVAKNDEGEPTYARFTIVEDTWYKGNRTVNYIDCVGFGPIAGLIEKLLQKGTLCYVEGSLISGSYQKGGQTYHTRNVKVDRLRVINRPENGSERQLDEMVQATEEDFIFDEEALGWDKT